MSSFFKTWKEDLPAGLVVFLVAVPLCLGIALASEAPLFSGLIAGVIGGMVIGLISGSAIGVSGPAAGLTAIVASALSDLGSFELFLCAVVLAGIFQILLGLLRAGFVSGFFPNVVIKGMLAAIGVIIILKQLPHAVGYDKDPEGDEDFFQTDGENTFSEIYQAVTHFTTASAITITVLSLAVLILWDRKIIQKTFLRFVPGPLAVVLLGIILTVVFRGTSWELISNHRVDLGVSGKPVNELFSFPDFSQIFSNSKIFIIALTLAVVASLETLLSVEASDKLDPLRRTTSGNRELLAQGIGNTISGMIGGLPITQVIVRTSANVNSGGKTRLSAVFHGFLIVVAVASIPMAFNYIPYASLAAILLQVGFKLARPSMILSVLKEGWEQFIPFSLTIVFVVVTNLLEGVAIGLASAVIITVIQRIVSGKPRRKKIRLIHSGNNYEMQLPDFLSFVRKPLLLKTLMSIPGNSNLKIDLSNVTVVHPDISDAIANFIEKSASKNIHVELHPVNMKFNF